MNILYLNNSVHLGGDTKCILKLCKELKEENNIYMASRGGVLKEEFEKLGVRHLEINNVRDKRISNTLKNIIKLKKIINQNDIEIIHSHHRMTTLLAKLATKFTDVKVVHTQHLCIEDKFKLTKLSLNNINTITVSESAKKILVEKARLDGNRITTIYNTIELESENKEIDSRLMELKDKGYFLVAQVSRIIDYKGIYDFVEVAKKTKEINKNVKFIFIGDGPERIKMEEYIKKSNLEDHVILLGSKNNVIEHLKHINLLILCSYIEGLPLAPIEAFSQSIPVIATNIDGTNEEIINDYNGYLVEKRDICSFSKYINKIAKDEELYFKLKRNALKTFEDKFTCEKYVNSHKELYKNIIK